MRSHNDGVEVDLAVVRRAEGYFVMFSGGGRDREIGPLASESDAMLYYNYLMNVAMSGGGFVLDDNQVIAKADPTNAGRVP